MKSLLKLIVPVSLIRKARLTLHPFYLASASFCTLPNFIIVGAQKAGTTSLFAYLRQHPQIRLSYEKEVHYFDKNYHKGVMWYRSHFPLSITMKNGDISGEATPYYLAHPHTPARIHELMPSVQLIVLLRDPVKRAISHYYHNIRLGIEQLPLMEALQKEEERTAAEWNKMLENESYCSQTHQNFSYKQRGVYIEQLARYFRYFNKEQVFIMNSDELFRDPKRAIQSVCGFLGVDPEFAAIDTVPKNANPMAKAVPAEASEYLRHFFSSYNKKLYEYLGRDFGWDN